VVLLSSLIMCRTFLVTSVHSENVMYNHEPLHNRDKEGYGGQTTMMGQHWLSPNNHYFRGAYCVSVQDDIVSNDFAVKRSESVLL